jgi:hypothetical protein
MTLIKKNIKMIILMFITSGLFSHSIDFFQEEIDINVHDNNCTVTGKYYFKNVSSKGIKKSLFYPFFIDKNSLYPDSINIIELAKNENIDSKKSKKGVFFSIYIKPKSVLIIEVFYKQKTLSNKMEYILTTTEVWGKPLELTKFNIKIPKKYKLKHISYKYDEILEQKENNIYRINKKDFLPEKNLIIKWQE